MVVVVVTGTRADSHLIEVVSFVEVAGLPHLVLLVLVNEGTIFRGITFYVVGLPGLFNSSRFRIILYLILIRKGLPLIPLDLTKRSNTGSPQKERSLELY